MSLCDNCEEPVVGRRSRFCSVKCTASASIRKKKYGMDVTEIRAELYRQGFKCYGCLSPITMSTAMFDHDHASGKFRGLLCRPCNLGLGNLKDAPAVLRRLMAYIERDREKKLVYVGGALKNPRIPEVGNALRAAGFDAMDEWWTPGAHADENWQEYEKLRGRTYAEALRGRSATNVYLFDRAYLDVSDAFVLVLPAGKSAMLELGYMSGLDKQTIIFTDGKDPERYDVMPRAADTVAATLEEVIEALQ